MKKYDVYFFRKYWQDFYFNADAENEVTLSAEQIIDGIIEEGIRYNCPVFDKAETMQFNSLEEAENAVEDFMQTAKFDIRNITEKHNKVIYEGFIDFAIIETNEYEKCIDEDDGSVYFDCVENYESAYYAKEIKLSNRGETQ